MLLPGRPLRTPPAALLTAVRRLLRPLVRLMMRSGVTFPVLADLLRRLFVEVAVSEILTQPRARTDSRISLLTGVHRKEIKRLREMPPDVTEPPEVVTIGSQIIARWLATPPFVDADGQALPLARVAEAGGGEASFDALVASVTTDVRPRAVLDDWLSQGIVRMADGDRVLLNTAAFIPSPGGQDQLFFFARNLHDHIAAAVANISAAEVAPFLDRSVHYDRLTADQAEQLEAFARAAAVRVLLEVNRRALELVEANQAADPVATRRVNFGMFVFGDADEPAAAAETAPAGRPGVRAGALRAEAPSGDTSGAVSGECGGVAVADAAGAGPGADPEGPVTGAPVTGGADTGAPDTGAPVTGAPDTGALVVAEPVLGGLDEAGPVVVGAPLAGASVAGVTVARGLEEEAPVVGLAVAGALLAEMPPAGTSVDGTPVDGISVLGAPVAGALVAGTASSIAERHPDDAAGMAG